MFDNLFIPSQPSLHRRWRLPIFFVGFLLGGIGIFFTSRSTSPEFGQIRGLLDSVRGGDVAVPHESAPVHRPPPVPILHASSTPAPIFTAASVLVKDRVSGAVLFSKDPYAPRSMASITKLMSAIILFDVGPLPMTATATVVSDTVIDTHMYAGDTYTIADLWRSALVGSSNKAILTLVDTLGWSRDLFVNRMNEKAIELGMTSTVFFDPTGLDERNVSTASDIAILLKEALGKQLINETVLLPEYTLYAEERGVTHQFWNTNWLLLQWIPHTFAAVRGGKTGYIPSSGYNFTVEVSNTSGQTLDVVVLGADTHEARFTEARDAAEWVFANFGWPL